MSFITQFLGKFEIGESTTNRSLKVWTILVYIFLYAPVAVVILLSFTTRSTPGFPMEGFSLEWYWQLIPPDYEERLIEALMFSLQLGIVSAIGAGIVGTLAALGMTRHNIGSRFLQPKVLNTVFVTPIVVPWIVTGIAVLALFAFLGISGTFTSLVIGHILITVPFVVIVTAARLYGFDRSLEEAARNLGASRIRTFYEITLPLISPGIIAGMLFAFTLSFDNFTQTFFWAGGNTSTLPIVIYSDIMFGLDPTINAISTVIVVFSVTIATIGEYLARRWIT